MRRLLIAFALAAVAGTPAVAQSQPSVGQAPEAGKFVEKVVCQRVEEERSTGSRLSSTTKVCRTVKVPVEEAEHQNKSSPRS